MISSTASKTPAPQQRTDSASLFRRLEFHRLLGEVSTQFISLPIEEVDAHINEALARVGGVLGFNLVAIAKFTGHGRAGEVTHIWTAEGLPPIPPGFTELDFPWIAERLRQGYPVYFTCLKDLPQAGERDRQTYERFGIQSGFNWPLRVEGVTLGNLCLASVGQERPFPVGFEQELELLAQVLASTLARQRDDLALRESEGRLSLAADAAGAGLWSLNLATGRYWLTTKTRELFHVSVDEVVSFERFLGLVHPDDRELVRQTVQTVVQSKDEGQVEYRIVWPDGSTRWILSRGRIYGDHTRKPVYLMGVSLDITERKQREEVFFAIETRLASGADLAGLGFYEVENGERVTFLDDRARAILGVPLERAEGSGTVAFWFEHIHPDDRPRLIDAHNRLNDGKLERLAIEYRYLHPQNGLVWIHHLARVLRRDAAARAVHTIGVLRDITEQRRSEMEMEELRNNLAHSDRVTLLGQLASALAHELSQPLGAILRNAEAAELLLQEPSPDLEELRAIVLDILKDDQRAGKVIDRLRSLLKRRSVEMQPLDLAEVIGEVLALLRADAVARHVTLVHSPSPERPLVRGDRIQLQQVLLNLLVNGMDALADPTLKDRSIHVTVHKTATPGLIEVQVRDNGPGLAGGSADRVFMPFVTTKTNGLGMGLSVSKTIIEAHQGKIWVDNHPEGGACFHFTLPAASGEGLVTSGKERSGE